VKKRTGFSSPSEIIEKTLEFLKKGKVVVFPTDTVYGLIADATNKKAVERIFKIKKRPKTKPLPVFVQDLKMAKKIAVIGKNQGKFLKSVWPGPITVILKRKSSKIKLYGVADDNIGLRISRYKIINYLLLAVGLPLVQTSANISGQPPARNIKEIMLQFKDKKHQPDLIIDGGTLLGKQSTVLDLTAFPPKILRK